MHETRRSRRPRIVALLAVAMALALPAASAAETTWEIRGRGWGHGIGLSQWGAFGYAKKGRSWKQIVRHYYRHTKIGSAPGAEIRVLPESGGDTIDFTEATRACGAELDAGKTYTAVRDGGSVRLRGPEGQDLGACGESLQATGQDAIRLAGKGAYRGSLIFVPRDGGLYAINSVPLEAYLRGVV